MTKANSLVGSSGRAIKHTRGARAVPTDCNGVLTLYELINTNLGQSLTASITTYSDDLTAYAGAAGSCSSLKSSFDKITVSLTVTVATLTTEITTVQSQLEGKRFIITIS